MPVAPTIVPFMDFARLRCLGIVIAASGLGPSALAEAQEAEGQRREGDPAVAVARSPVHAYDVTISLGFSHWYGDTFGAPIGLSTPGLTVGWVATSWLELQLGYSISVMELPLPNDEGSEDRSRIGYLTLAVLLRRELDVAGERLMFGAGPLVGVVHTKDGLGLAAGAGMVSRYLIAVSEQLSVGPFLDARAVIYALPGSSRPFYEVNDDNVVVGHSDAHIQIGVAFAL